MEYSDAEMKKFDDSYQKQILFNFSERRGVEKKKAAEGRGSRSADLDLDHNTQAFNVETTDFRELSRYPLEDMLKSRQGTKFLVLIAKDAAEYEGIPKDAAKLQREAGIGGEDTKISGEWFFCKDLPLSIA